MLQTKQSLNGQISAKQSLSGTLNNPTIKVYPELEDLEITPSTEEQNYSGSFGNVKVNGITSDELTITPTTEEQVYEGLYNKVSVAGEENYIAENIRSGISMWGLEGNYEGDSSYNAIFKITTNEETFDIKKHITEVLNLDLSKITSNVGFQNAFKDCINLKKLSLVNTENIQSFYYSFNNCKNLEELSVIDGSSCTSFGSAFYNCQKLKNIKITNTSNNTSCYQMFMQCYLLEEGPEMDTSNVTNMGYMFNNCTAIHTIPQYQAGKVNRMNNSFTNVTKLQNLGGFVDLGKAYTQTTANYSNYTLNLSPCTLLTHDSLMNVINNLYDLNLTYDVASGGTLYRLSLILGETNLAKLTDEEIAIATNKGWTVS